MKKSIILTLFLIAIQSQAASLKDLVNRANAQIIDFEFKNNVACIMMDNSINGSLTPMDGLLDKHGIEIKYFCKEAASRESQINQVLIKLQDTKVRFHAKKPADDYELYIDIKRMERKH